ncbi:MAG: glycosyltransferase [Erysipelotrichaceae bacterium]|nr:glycosyltransferase [Erysipelotrichaceae bacterium]
MISVVVPVYNVEKYILPCIESILKQSCQDFELILVDDGSKDRSIPIAKEYLQDKNISYRIVEKENGGLASARNAGLKAAKGDYISFIDADDAISADFLERLKDTLEKNDVDFSFCAFSFTKQQIPPQDSSVQVRLFSREELMETFLKRTIAFVVPSMLFRKEFLLNNGLYFDEKIRFSEDQPFIWNVLLHQNRAVYLYRKMYGYYIRENSIMTGSSYDKLLSSYQEYKENIGRMFQSYPQYKEIADRILPRWKLGALYSAAKLLDYSDYRKLYEIMEGRKILSQIKGIGERNAYLLGAVCSFSPRVLYELCRRLNLNG